MRASRLVRRRLAPAVVVASGIWLAAGAGCATVSPAAAELLKAVDQDYRAGRWRAAESQASGFIRQYPASPAVAEAYYLRGMARFQQGLIAQAEGDFQRALAASRRQDLSARAHAMLGHLAMQRDDAAAAVQHYRVAVADLPERPPKDEVYYRYGLALRRIGQWDEARLPLARLIERYPQSRYYQAAKRRLAWPGRYFSIQCGIYRKLENARRQVRRLRAAGLDARQSIDVSGKDAQYVVLLGRYSTYGAAKADLARVKAVVPDAMVVP